MTLLTRPTSTGTIKSQISLASIKNGEIISGFEGQPINVHCKDGQYLYDGNFDLVPPPDLKDGDLIIVWDDIYPNTRYVRMFSGWCPSGKVIAHGDGLTGIIIKWDNFELPNITKNKLEIRGIVETLIEQSVSCDDPLNRILELLED